MTATHKPRPRLGAFVSGSGTNLQAILDAIASGHIYADVKLVVSNRKAAFGLVRAERAGIDTLYAPMKPYSQKGLSREQYDADLAERVSTYHLDLMVLAGWMHVFTSAFLDHFPQQVINLHPALPGMFPGRHAIEQAFAAYHRGEIVHSGCMVHYAVPEVDAGPVIGQSVVPILPDDTLESFEARMHEHEHRLIIASVQQALAAL